MASECENCKAAEAQVKELQALAERNGNALREAEAHVAALVGLVQAARPFIVGLGQVSLAAKMDPANLPAAAEKARKREAAQQAGGTERGN